MAVRQRKAPNRRCDRHGESWGPGGECKRCHAEREIARYHKDPDKMREYFYKRDFGITIADYERILEQQGGRCAICGGQEESGKRLAIDHCHRTNKVRGLLCCNCNQGIGRFKDEPDLLKQAATYLEAR